VTPAEAATVYVVDDDEAVRDSLLFLLQVDGLPVRGFAGAAEFLAALPQLTAGCVVTDLRMPGLDGAELLRQLSERAPHLPVIVMTGHGDVAAAARVAAAGAFDFIEKPFQDTAILQAVRAALESGPADSSRAERAKKIGETIAHLPARERGVLEWLMQGEGSRAVIASYGVALSDIDLLRARLMLRMGAESVPDLVRLVMEARRFVA
jgi:two-component system response regulator FixJ